jgi:hypothetical protein
LLSKVPYIHLLPKSIYRFILKIWGISDSTIAALLEIKSTGISIDRFEKIIKKEGYSINRKTFFFINPNYETKFKLKPREQLRIVSSIPWVRNFLITAAYYILSIDENHLN